jgi:signal transduction histidine kinase
LQNFITNAIKYTDTGSITLAAKADPKGVRFAVEDSGIGISKSDQERVYDKFFRSEDFRTRKSSGTGLGLYVTMKLARLIHADISLKSELNKGSTFSIFIPSLSETYVPAVAGA